MSLRPLLETVPETEVLFPGKSQHGLEDSDFWRCGSNVRVDDCSQAANAMLLERLLDCMTELGKSKERIKYLEETKDKERKYIVSKLLYLEGSLLKDKQAIASVIAEKDKEIAGLQRQLQLLHMTNSRQSTKSLDSTDSAIGSLDQLSLSICSPPFGSSKQKASAKRNVTDPDKSSVEGALLFNTKGRYSKTELEELSPTVNSTPEIVLMHCETKTLDNERVPTNDKDTLEIASPRELRSYSNPDDFQQVYQKTSDLKVQDKEFIRITQEISNENNKGGVTDGETLRGTGSNSQSMTRKKSLSSPDLQLSVNPPADAGRALSGLTDADPKHCTHSEVTEENLRAPITPRPSLPSLQSPLTSSLPSVQLSDSKNSQEAIFEEPFISLLNSPSFSQKARESLLPDPANGFRFRAPPIDRQLLSNTATDETHSTNYLSPKLVQSLNSSPVNPRRQQTFERGRSAPSSIKISRLIKRPALVLRSYSVPATAEASTGNQIEANSSVVSSQKMAFDEQPAICESENILIEEDIQSPVQQETSSEYCKKPDQSEQTESINHQYEYSNNNSQWERSNEDTTDQLLTNVVKQLSSKTSVSTSPIYF